MEEKNNIITPIQIAESWDGQFTFKKETCKSSGLRSPQLGALYAILAHIEEGSSQSGIVVMPTGTGKTETMLSFMVANKCHKVFVVVPFDALRNQTYRKFKSLGLLPILGVVPNDINLPIVNKVTKKLTDDEWIALIEKSNVIVTTMALASKVSETVKGKLRSEISYLFVDEAHHSEAETWTQFITIFPPSHVLLFTATPFRNDGQRLKGKVIFNFSLKKAQEQNYYEQIKFVQIMEYAQEDADRSLAKKAVSILKNDLAQGYDHILMARCKSISRAKQVFEYYKEFTQYSPVIVFSAMKKGMLTLKEILEGKHKIIVCVNMLGEGYDLPQLKIAAIHDEKQSLAITLQFIGRFTRTSGHNLGKASFVINLANPPIAQELNSLYQYDADWNSILPRLSDKAANEQQKLSEFLNNFHGNLSSEISLEDIRPALSVEVYTTDSTTTNFNNWDKYITSKNYNYILHSLSNDTLVLALGNESLVDWGDIHSVHNLSWEIIIVYFDANTKRVYLNSSFKFKGENLLVNMFSNIQKICDEDVFRIFANIDRLRLFNVGARLRGKDISYQSYIGSSVQDGMDRLTQGKLIKNNLFGVGYKKGEKASIGCSCKGKIWSRERANLLQFQKWCKEIGKIVTDKTIDTNVVLENTLRFNIISHFPSVQPIAIDWNPDIYEHYTLWISFNGELVSFDNCDLSLLDSTIVGVNIEFSISTENYYCNFRIVIEPTNKVCKYVITDANAKIEFVIGDKNSGIEFLDEHPFSLFLADNSYCIGNNRCEPKKEPDQIPEDLIKSIEWNSEFMNISQESIYRHLDTSMSIQQYISDLIIDKYDYLINDDGKNEISDLIGINDSQFTIDITLYHLKYAHGGVVSNNINNLYEVCGQAHKSERWKYVSGQKFFNHILQRNEDTIKSGKPSRIMKGKKENILKLRQEATNQKEMKFHVVIVQPGMSKKGATTEMKILLGTTYQYLHQIANIDLQVICSE